MIICRIVVKQKENGKKKKKKMFKLICCGVAVLHVWLGLLNGHFSPKHKRVMFLN